MREIKIIPSITERDSDAVNRYMTEISRIPLLSPDEETVVSRKAREGDTAAMERLIKTNLRFVVSVAKNYQQRGLSLGDLINEGNLGLIKAAARFDPTRGFRFISFAVWWIRQSILLALAEQTRIVRLPLNHVSSLTQINKIITVLEQELERHPTPAEIAAKINQQEKKIKEHIYDGGKTLSIDFITDEESETSFLDVIPADIPAPDHKLLSSPAADEVRILIHKLSRKERQVITLFYGLAGQTPMSLDDIARQFNLSRERIRQVRDRSIRKLRFNAKFKANKNH